MHIYGIKQNPIYLMSLTLTAPHQALYSTVEGISKWPCLNPHHTSYISVFLLVRCASAVHRHFVCLIVVWWL